MERADVDGHTEVDSHADVGSHAEVDRGDEAFDAYLSFGEADRAWVEEELVPRLEAAGRSVCREDQLAPGGIEVEERCRAMAASRKTLLVLSPAYLENRWTTFEEAVTLEMDPAARKRRLVPILRDADAVPLRIRPLVSVDLRGDGDEGQWKRLVDAVDPTRQAGADAGPVQRLSLKLAVATAELAAPTWHPAGTAWLAAVGLAYCLLLTLAYLVWWEMPPLRNSALLLGFLLPAAGMVLAWREDRDLFRRLSHLLAGGRLTRLAVALLLALVVMSWARAGVPRAREILCGPFGCREPGTVYVTIAGFEAADPGSEAARSWADRSLRSLRLKLASAGDRVRVLASDLPQVGESDLRRLQVDYTLAGHFDGGGLPVLAATLWDRNHALVSPGWRSPAASTPGTAASRRSPPRCAASRTASPGRCWSAWGSIWRTPRPGAWTPCPPPRRRPRRATPRASTA